MMNDDDHDDRGAPVVNVYAGESMADATGAMAANSISSSSSITGSTLRRGDYSPIAAWRYLKGPDESQAISYNRMRVSESSSRVWHI